MKREERERERRMDVSASRGRKKRTDREWKGFPFRPFFGLTRSTYAVEYGVASSSSPSPVSSMQIANACDDRWGMKHAFVEFVPSRPHLREISPTLALDLITLCGEFDPDFRSVSHRTKDGRASDLFYEAAFSGEGRRRRTTSLETGEKVPLGDGFFLFHSAAAPAFCFWGNWTASALASWLGE